MKNRRRKRLHHYIIFLLAVCILLGFLLDHVIDFFVGFLAGWNRISDMEDGTMMFDGPGRMIGQALIGTLSIALGVCCYRRLRRQVTAPIERLAESMKEVGRGNLSVRTSTEGGFEIAGIQEAFNSMVQELENAGKNRERSERKNQELYAGIAHDLKTPMTMVLGYARLLEQDAAVSTEDKNRYLRTIIEQTEHTNELLDSLLTLTKLENQSYPLRKEKRDLVECLRECAADYYPMIEKAEMQLELQLPDHEITCVFDPVEMKRVFTNLLSNMVKHNPKKTSCVILLEEAQQTPGQRKIRIVIADDGPKIPEKLRTSLFDTFAVGEASRNTKNGSGLGLSISRKIIERHGSALYYLDHWRGGYKGFVIDWKIDAGG